MLALASVEQLIAWTVEPALQVRCRFGKHPVMPWREVGDGSLRWAAEREFDEDTLFTVRQELQRRQEPRGSNTHQPDPPVTSVASALTSGEAELPF